MKLLRPFLLAMSLAAVAGATPAAAGPARENDEAFEAAREGRSMPLPQLKRRVMPLVGGADYLGPELNGTIYRFKFIRRGKVIWIDVDARTGEILRKSGD